eukprot:gene17951-21413_t
MSAIDALIKKFSHTLGPALLAQEEKVAPTAEQRLRCDVPAKKLSAARQNTKSVKSRVEDNGVKSLLRQLDQGQLTCLYEPFEIVPEDDEKVPTRNRIYLIKKLKNQILSIGLDKYFEEASKSVASIILPYVASETIAEVADELRQAGFEMLLNDTPVATLQQMCADINIDIKSQSSSVLIKCLLTGKAPKKSKKSQKVVQIEFCEEKLELTKENDLTFQDIFQHYFLDELQDYCREDGLKISGTKVQVINRILNSFKGIREEPKKIEKKPDTKVVATKKKVAAPKKPTTPAVVADTPADESDDQESDDEDDDEDEEDVAPQEQKVVTPKKKGAAPVSTEAPVDDDEDDEDEDEDEDNQVYIAAPKNTIKKTTEKPAAAVTSQANKLKSPLKAKPTSVHVTKTATKKN